MGGLWSLIEMEEIKLRKIFRIPSPSKNNHVACDAVLNHFNCSPPMLLLEFPPRSPCYTARQDQGLHRWARR